MIKNKQFFWLFLMTSNYLYAQQPILLIIGTRPEGIKMAPVYHACKQLQIPTLVCSTDQHTDLLVDVLKVFDITPDFNLNIMQHGQDLFHITISVLEQLKTLYATIQPSLVVVQGDTSSAAAAALAAFYLKIPVAHVEAGLRTYNINSPFPEELNRRIISLISSYHFAPTESAVAQLLQEKILPDTIYNVGNTVVDALYYVQQKITRREILPSDELKNIIARAKTNNRKIVTLTAHRRESFAHGLQSVFTAIKKSIELYPDMLVIFPMHPNPLIKGIVQKVQLDATPHLIITKPLSYIDMVYLLMNSAIVATDSGGLQEEAISLNKPVLVLRNETERYEGVNAGISQIVGFDQEQIITAIGSLLTGSRKVPQAGALYGNGDSGKQIATIIKEKFSY